MTRGILIALSLLALGGCVTANVDEMTFDAPIAGIGEGSVVILGRRHAPDYDTEPDFIECIGDHIARRDSSITVIPEQQFVNSLYPWFEPRTAPLGIEGLDRLMGMAPVADKISELNLNYMVWVDGRTQDTNGTGTMTCGIDLPVLAVRLWHLGY